MKIKFAPYNVMSFDNSLCHIIIDFPDSLIDTIKVGSNFEVVDKTYEIKGIEPSVVQTANGYELQLTLKLYSNTVTSPYVITRPEENPPRGSKITDYWKDVYENERIALLATNGKYVADNNNLAATFTLNPGASL